MHFARTKFEGVVSVGFTVRNAVMRDLPELLILYGTAKKIMDASGNPNQWEPGYPGEEKIVEDLLHGTLFVILRDGRIGGCFVLAPGKDPTYAAIYEGKWSSEKPYATIHRLAGDGNGGIFSACMEYAKARYAYLSIDTHRDNRIMRNLLCEAGFRRCGIIYLENGSERISFDYEKESPAS